MKFDALILYQMDCPITNPYIIIPTKDCVAACPSGYTADVNKNCIVDLNLNLQTIVKLPSSNRIEMLLDLIPNDPTINSLYPSVLWNNVVNLDVPTSYKTV